MSDYILRLPEVRKRTGLPTSTIYYLIARGDFPAQIHLSKRLVGWSSSAIEQWVEERKQNSSSETINVDRFMEEVL